ncbi:MAG: hypothetical protein ABIH24_02160 [Verrucomicrobiota bacterium]
MSAAQRHKVAGPQRKLEAPGSCDASKNRHAADMDATHAAAAPTRILPAAPGNDFPEFIRNYFDECHRRMPAIEAIAGKWSFEDLIPGMSDFDTRFLCADSMTAADWCRMSMIVGQVHLDLCRKYPQWVRILEHLPGINLTWNELADEITYYPEYLQWTFYHSTNAPRQQATLSFLERRAWDRKDEYFHLKKFLLYYGPYDRSFDRSINLGPYAVKYPLHSRLMHYFTPPLQSAVSICLKRPVRGKMEALRLAAELFPETPVFREVLDLAASHYESPELYDEPALTGLEHRLLQGLDAAASGLKRHISILPPAAVDSGPQAWRLALGAVRMDPALLIFDNAKFARLMRGRLYFYVNAPAYFDHVYLIQNELNRIGHNFFHVPFSIFRELARGEKTDDPAAFVPSLVPELLTAEEAACTLEFARLAGQPYAGREDAVARAIIRVFDGFYCALYKVSQATINLARRSAS